MDQPSHLVGFESRQPGNVPLNRFKECLFANQSDLYPFDVSSTFVPIRKRFEQLKVIYDRPRRRECPDEVLLPEGVDPIFDADAGVGLAQSRSGHANVAKATMGCSRSQSDHVQQSSATNRIDV